MQHQNCPRKPNTRAILTSIPHETRQDEPQCCPVVNRKPILVPLPTLQSLLQHHPNSTVGDTSIEKIPRPPNANEETKEARNISLPIYRIPTTTAFQEPLNPTTQGLENVEDCKILWEKKHWIRSKNRELIGAEPAKRL